MLRPPSNQKHYDVYFSGDPALEQLPDDASDDAQAEHGRKLKLAAQSGDWSALIKPGQTPTKFVLRPLPGDVFRQLVDMRDKLGSAKLNQLYCRAALIEVSNLGEHDVKLAIDSEYPKLGKIAKVDIADYLDQIDLRIVTELANYAFAKAVTLDPLS